MNLKFNNQEDIDYNDKTLIYLKEKYDIASNFFSIVRLYNLLVKRKGRVLNFKALKDEKNFSSIVSTLYGFKIFDNIRLQSEEFVSSLAKHEKISSDINSVDYTFDAKLNESLKFLEKCSRPECFKVFLSKYKSIIDNYEEIDEKSELKEFKLFEKIESDYLNAWYIQDVKKMYFILGSLKDKVDKEISFDKVEIIFNKSFSLDNNSFVSISFINDTKKEVFNWSYKMTFRMSNMLSLKSIDTGLEDVNSFKHSLIIENTLESWKSFDKIILDSYYDEFSKVCLYNKLNNSLEKKNTRGLRKV